jgi:hypothetical protein
MYITDGERGKMFMDCVQAKYDEAEEERKESAKMLQQGRKSKIMTIFHQKQHRVAMIYWTKLEIGKSLGILNVIRKKLMEEDTTYIENTVWEKVASKLYSQSTNGGVQTHTFIGKDKTYILSKRAMFVIQNTHGKKTHIATQAPTSCSSTCAEAISSQSDTTQEQDTTSEETMNRQMVIQEATESGALLFALASMATQVVNRDTVIEEAAETGRLLSTLAHLVAESIGLSCTSSREIPLMRDIPKRSTSRRVVPKRAPSQRNALHTQAVSARAIVTRSTPAEVHVTDAETDIATSCEMYSTKRKYNVSFLLESGIETTQPSQKRGVCRHTRSQVTI